MMREGMKKWLKKRNLPEINPDDAQGLCNKLGVEGEKYDSCMAFIWQMEKGDITEAEFLAGLSVIAGKEPEEVAGILRGEKLVAVIGDKGVLAKGLIKAIEESKEGVPKVSHIDIAELEKKVAEGGRDIALVKEWAKTEGKSQVQYIQRLREIIEDLSIPKTFVTSLGFEVEIPVAMAVEALAEEGIISSGFHGALNQRWTIVIKSIVGEKVSRAAETAGLEVTSRGYFTDISLPDVGITEIEKATEVFNRFAGLYEEKDHEQKKD